MRGSCAAGGMSVPAGQYSSAHHRQGQPTAALTTGSPSQPAPPNAADLSVLQRSSIVLPNGGS